MVKKLLMLLIVVMSIVSATVTYNSLSPVNNTQTADTTPDFTFTAVSDVDTSFSSELFINDVGYGLNDSVQNNTQTTITANSSLSDGVYTWYINSTDTNGTTQSEVRTITIDTVPPKKPSLNSPANGSTGVSTSPVLSFTVFDDTGTMNVTLYSVTTGEVLKTWTDVANGTTLSYTWWARRKNTTYEWYVNVTDVAGTNTSDTWSFTTEDSFNVSTCAELWVAGTYNLTADIINSTANDGCIRITGSNIVLDGKGFKIDGNLSLDSNQEDMKYGVYVNAPYTTVKNALISNWQNGIYLDTGADNSNIENNTLSDFKSPVTIRLIGIYIKNSDGNNISLINITNFIGASSSSEGGNITGFYLVNSSYNNIDSILIDNLEGGNATGYKGKGGIVVGMELNFSNNNNITSNTLSNFYVGKTYGYANNFSYLFGSSIGFYVINSESNWFSLNIINNLTGGEGWSSSVSGYQAGDGGFAVGFYLVNSSSNSFSSNNISNLTGGDGGDSNKGVSAATGDGGFAAGFYVLNSTNISFDTNHIDNLNGGRGGDVTASSFIHGGDGGFAVGFYVLNSTITNLVSDFINDLIGGTGGSGYYIGYGGAGGNAIGIYGDENQTMPFDYLYLNNLVRGNGDTKGSNYSLYLPGYVLYMNNSLSNISLTIGYYENNSFSNNLSYQKIYRNDYLIEYESVNTSYNITHENITGGSLLSGGSFVGYIYNSFVNLVSEWFGDWLDETWLYSQQDSSYVSNLSRQYIEEHLNVSNNASIALNVSTIHYAGETLTSNSTVVVQPGSYNDSVYPKGYGDWLDENISISQDSSYTTVAGGYAYIKRNVTVSNSIGINFNNVDTGVIGYGWENLSYNYINVPSLSSNSSSVTWRRNNVITISSSEHAQDSSYTTVAGGYAYAYLNWSVYNNETAYGISGVNFTNVFYNTSFGDWENVTSANGTILSIAPGEAISFNNTWKKAYVISLKNGFGWRPYGVIIANGITYVEGKINYSNTDSIPYSNVLVNSFGYNSSADRAGWACSYNSSRTEYLNFQAGADNQTTLYPVQCNKTKVIQLVEGVDWRSYGVTTANGTAYVEGNMNFSNTDTIDYVNVLVNGSSYNSSADRTGWSCSFNNSRTEYLNFTAGADNQTTLYPVQCNKSGVILVINYSSILQNTSAGESTIDSVYLYRETTFNNTDSINYSNVTFSVPFITKNITSYSPVNAGLYYVNVTTTEDVITDSKTYSLDTRFNSNIYAVDEAYQNTSWIYWNATLYANNTISANLTNIRGNISLPEANYDYSDAVSVDFLLNFTGNEKKVVSGYFRTLAPWKKEWVVNQTTTYREVRVNVTQGVNMSESTALLLYNNTKVQINIPFSDYAAWYLWVLEGSSWRDVTSDPDYDFTTSTTTAEWNVPHLSTQTFAVIGSGTPSQGSTGGGGGGGGASVVVCPSGTVWDAETGTCVISSITASPQSLSFDLSPGQKKSEVVNITNSKDEKVTVELKPDQTWIYIDAPSRVLNPGESIGFLVTVSAPFKSGSYSGNIEIYADGVKRGSVPVDLLVTEESTLGVFLRLLFGEEYGNAIGEFMTKPLFNIGARTVYVSTVIILGSGLFSFMLYKKKFVMESYAIGALTLVMFYLFMNFII